MSRHDSTPGTHAHADLARELLAQWRLSEAESAIHRALRHEPNHPDLLCELCLVYCYSGREAQAVRFFDRAIAGARGQKLGRILAEHLQCRKLLNLKRGRNDPRLDEMLVKVRRHYRGEISEVGVRLAACMIVRDEAQNLPRCLKSLHGVVDEVVVVDTGSKDETLRIAGEFGAKIGHYEWTDNFAAARNHALSLCTADWVLWIDADEELPGECVEAFCRAIVRPQFGGFSLQILNYTDDEEEASQFVHSHVRLFRRLSGVCFTGRVHEQVAPSLEALGLPQAALDGGKILHYGYRPRVLEERDKVRRSIEMLEREVKEMPEDPFHWFNLANALTVAGRWTEAEHAARVCGRLAGPERPFARLNWQLLANALQQLGKPLQALEACTEAEAAGCGGLLNDFERANVLVKLDRYEEALEASDRCMAATAPEGDPIDNGILTHKRQMQRGQILALLGRHEEALTMLDLAIAGNPEGWQARYMKAATLEKAGRLAESLEIFDACAERPELRGLALKGAARIHSLQGQWSEAAIRYEAAWRSDNQDIDSWVGWAKACEALGDVMRVVQAYEAFAQIHEPSVEILINWGRALDESGQRDRALHCFTEAVKRDPKNPNAYFNCGDLLYKMEQYQDAAHLYESGLRHEPLNAQGWFVLANALARLGLIDGAKMSYRQALIYNPKHAEARHNLQLLEEGLEAA
jgi:tetratricopeptide (TPR) repeat protein